MVDTRSSSASTTRSEERGNGGMITTSDTDVNALFETLPEEYKTVVKVITEIITSRISEQITDLQKQLAGKDKQIDQLKHDITSLTCRVENLELQLDECDQYQRRDTVILSGASLPPEAPQENTTNIVTQTIKNQLKINIKETDISVSHRLGQKRQQYNRPIIVKLVNRSLKHDLVGACIQLRPQLHVNESLTPKRRDLLNKILTVRKAHRQKFQQCYTQDGRIIIKLRNSTVKHTIITETQLLSFLERYPEMMDTLQESSA